MVVKPSTRAPRGARVYSVWRSHVRVSFWWRGKWRGIGLPSWETFSWGGPYPVLLHTRGVRTVVKKPSVRAEGEAAPGALPGAWGSTMPTLSGWLCDSTYPDGSAIGPVQLQLRREGSVVRATLKISDQGGLKVSAIETSPLDACLALDLLLSGDAVPWEADLYPLGGKAAPKKK